MHHGDFEDAFALHATRQHETRSECVIDSTLSSRQLTQEVEGEEEKKKTRQDQRLKCRKISYRFYKMKVTDVL